MNALSDEPEQSKNRRRIRHEVLTYLTRKDHSQFGLRKKLEKKGHANEDIEVVLQELIATGLINDDLFAHNYTARRRSQGYGPKRIKLELQTHGLAAETIAEALKIIDNAWLIEARRILQKRFKNLPQKTGQALNKARAKQIRFLQYRGFSQEQINQLLKEYYGQEQASPFE